MESERTKVAIRNIRKDANNDIKKLMFQRIFKIIMKWMSNLTDLYISKVDSIYLNKEKEILTV